MIIVLKGRKDRWSNIARALISIIPELLAPEMKAIYNRDFLDVLSAHIARSISRDHPTVVTSINEALSVYLEERRFRELSSKLVTIDDQSLFSRILVPELIRVAKFRYPQRDPEIDDEVYKLIDLLYRLSKGEEVKLPLIYGKYFRMVFVRVARPEKIEKLLIPHINFVKSVMEKYKGINRIYVLAAGRNVAAGKFCLRMISNELKKIGKLAEQREYEYIGRYRDIPQMKLYLGRISLRS